MVALIFNRGLGFPQHTLVSLKQISQLIQTYKNLEGSSAATDLQSCARK